MDRSLPALALVVVLLASGAATLPAAGREATPAPPAAPCLAEHVDGLGMACVRPDGFFDVLLADGTVLTTHGPDPIPDGGDTGPLLDEERAPACGETYVQHVLYGRNANAPDRFLAVRAALQGHVRSMNALLALESLESGGVPSDYRVLCDAAGNVRVDAFTVPAGEREFGGVVNAARAAGFDHPQRDYTIFFDASHSAYCGVGSFADDDSPGVNNENNRGGDYGLTYVGCWSGRTPMHENGHNQGAVQRLATDSDTQGHCVDGFDVMCYTSGLGLGCRDRVHFDCGHDTYYDAEPEAGEWLAGHWNMGDRANRFLLWGGARAPDAPLLTGLGGDGLASLSWSVPEANGRPLTGYRLYQDGALAAALGTVTSHVVTGLANGATATFEVAAVSPLGEGARSNAAPVTPRAGNAPPAACFTLAVEFLTATANASCAADDGTLIDYAWDWGDGSPPASGLGAVHDYATPGSYAVTLTVRDDHGVSASTTRTATPSLPPDPDPAAETLSNGAARVATLSGLGAEHHYKIYVPPGKPFVRAKLDGPPCAAVGPCNPDLDLYVRHGERPTDFAYDCRPFEYDSSEVCMPLNPADGWWFVRVKLFVGTAPGTYTLATSY